MYRFRFINKIEQFGRTSMTLVLEDLETGMPEVRIEKEFNKTSKEIDEDFLYREASKDVAAATKSYTEDQAAAALAAQGEE